MAIGTRRSWSRAITAGSVGLIALLLSGCIEINQKSVINSDFTGTTTMRIGISKLFIDVLKQAGSSVSGTPAANVPNPTPSDLFADTKNQITALGGTATDYETDNFIGIDATLPFTSLDQMVSQINNLLGSGSGGPGALATITTSPTASGGIRIDGTVDPLSELSDPNGPGAASGIDPAAVLAAGGTVQLAFTMPGTITSADSLATTDGTTVSWSFKVGDPKATIFVEANKG